MNVTQPPRKSLAPSFVSVLVLYSCMPVLTQSQPCLVIIGSRFSMTTFTNALYSGWYYRWPYVSGLMLRWCSHEHTLIFQFVNYNWCFVRQRRCTSKKLGICSGRCRPTRLWTRIIFWHASIEGWMNRNMLLEYLITRWAAIVNGRCYWYISCSNQKPNLNPDLTSNCIRLALLVFKFMRQLHLCILDTWYILIRGSIQALLIWWPKNNKARLCALSSNSIFDTLYCWNFRTSVDETPQYILRRH